MKEKEIENLVRDISYLVSVDNRGIIKSVIQNLHPADLSEVFRHLSKEHRSFIFARLDIEIASAVLSQMSEHIRDDLVDDIDIDKLSLIASKMDSDDLTDLIARLPKKKAERVLASMDKEELEEVKELMSHDEKSAGGIMAKEFIAIYEDSTVGEAIDKIRLEKFEDIYYVFVVDNLGVIDGIIALNKLILAPLYKRIKDIMDRNIITVNTSLPQEEVARIAKKYDLISIPVVNDDRVLVGRITIDDIVDVIEEEASDDIHKMAGISDDSLFQSFFKMSCLRLPWLITGLFGGILAALLISFFEAAVEEIIVLSFFIPVIMSMGGSIGIQASTIMVRGFATGQISLLNSYKFLFKEVKVGILNGVACSVLFFVVIFVWQDMKLASLLALALFVIMFVASIVGSLIPLILRAFKVDPAIATGPFITISNDIIGLLIYFGLAILIL